MGYPVPVKVTQRAVSALEPSPGNPRVHDQRGIDAIADSIRTWGFIQPLVIRNREVIIGHGRLEAAKRIGLDKVPCVSLNDLTDEQIVALRAADNRVGELSGWDPDLLAADLRVTPDDLRIGWDAAELDAIIGELRDVELPELKAVPPPEPLPSKSGEIVSEPPAETLPEQAEPPPQHARTDVPPPRKGPLPELRAPFPYSGGKRRWANEINARLGTDVQTYVEPFAGSLAVLLSRPAARREVVCDTYALLVNAWRALVHAPDEVAEWCDWPTFHDDLIARRRWLGAWAAEHGAKVQQDADWYDAKAGGWWIWVQSQAIGGSSDGVVYSAGDIPFAHPQGGAAQGVQAGRKSHNGMENALPFVAGAQGAQAGRTSRPSQTSRPAYEPRGVQAGRKSNNARTNDIPYSKHTGSQGVQAHQKTDNRRPNISNRPTMENGVQASRRTDNRRPDLKDTPAGASGVQAHRKGASGGIPRLHDTPAGSVGVQAQRTKASGDVPSATAWPGGAGTQAHTRSSPAGGLPSSERWGPWFNALAARLKQVIVLNRPWQSGVTPAVLGEAGGGEIAILLDPPYVVEGRSTGLYATDSEGDDRINSVAEECHRWAIEHGDRYRIAYCHSLGSFSFPKGWVVRAQTYPGGQSTPATRRLDAIAFSPRCLDA